jgi:hypothetical protein
MSKAAPQKFADWMARHEHRDRQFGFVYKYHPRSDAHSVALCRLILEDLLDECTALREQAIAGRVVYGINAAYTSPLSGKKKTRDLAIGTGTPDTSTEPFAALIYRGTIDRLLISCEAKTVMTEHSKSKPRLFDELSSSHEIVHKDDQDAIAAGVAVVNIAETFISPLRQKGSELVVSRHKQPQAAQGMVHHLCGLPIRTEAQGVGFDAYATIVIDCNNREPAVLWTRPPAPQPGNPNEYGVFIDRISRAYADRFGE